MPNNETIVINNIVLDVNPTNIISREQRRVVEKEFIRENSVFSHASKYAKSAFTIILEFNLDDEIAKMKQPNVLPAYLKLLCQINNFPFLYIDSKRMRSFLSQTSSSEINGLMFGIEEYSVVYSSQTNNSVIIRLDLLYFNYVPFARNLSYYSIGPDPTQEEKSKIVNGKSNIRYTDKRYRDLASSDVFDIYFYKDYQSMFNRIHRYQKKHASEQDLTTIPIGSVKIRKPSMSEDQPNRDKDFEKIKISVLDEKNVPETKEMYVSWEDLGPVSQINKGAISSVPLIKITKRNNFASHSLTGWTHPVLQYMGKGSTSLSLSIVEDSKAKYSPVISMVKKMIGTTDVDELDTFKYSQFNLLKIDSIVVDLLPMFGFILDNESIDSNSELQDVNNAIFNFKGKDLGGLIKKQGYNTVDFRGTKIDFDLMIDTIEGIYNGYKDKASFIIFADAESDDSQPTGFSQSKIEELHTRKLNNKWPEGLSDTILNKIEGQNGIPKGTLFNLMMKESGGNPDAVRTTAGESVTRNGIPEGAIVESSGLFQFTPATVIGIKLNDPFDPLASAEAAGRLLKYNLNRYNGDTRLMLAAYNAGPTKVDKAIAANNGSTDWNTIKGDLWPITQDHVDKISRWVENDRYIAPNQDVSYTNKEINKIIPRIELLLENMKELFYEAALKRFTDKSPASKVFAKAKDAYVTSKDSSTTLWQILDRDVEELFLEFDSMYISGNRLLSAHMSGLSNFINDNHDVLINSFEGEAYSDLELGSRLLDLKTIKKEGAAGGWVNAKDKREINPMFFMNEEPYINEDILKRSYGYAKTDLASTAEELSKKISSRIIGDTGKIGTDSPLKAPFNDDKEKDKDKDHVKEKIKDIEVLSAINKIKDQPGLQASQSKPRGDYDLEMEDIGPGNEDGQSEFYFPRGAQPLNRGINQAFPVVKVFLVEGDEANLKANFGNIEHEYYELQGIMSVDIVGQTDDSPVDGAVIQMANPGSVYSDNSVYMDMIRPTKNESLRNTPGYSKLILNKLALRPGHRIHIKAGYSNDLNKLETMFNGVITDISGEDTLHLMCESFGRELIQFDHGDDPTTDNFYGGADTFEIISNFLFASEIEHFGNYKFFDKDRDKLGAERKRLTVANFYMYNGSDALFMNIFSENIIGDYSFGLDFSNLINNKSMVPFYPIYRTTPWEALKEMEYRHPGSLTRACHYGDRHTLFFGIKEQLYVYRDLHPGLSRSISDPGLRKKLRLKPVSDVHLISTDHNLISNNLRVTSDFDTVVDIAYWNKPKDIKSGDLKWYEMKMDDNLRPSAHRKGRLEKKGIGDKYTAFVYGSTHLRKEAEKMYDGKIVITGNQNIKSGDYAVLDDSSRNLSGMIKIRECRHHFSPNGGFITTIKPGLYVESSHTDYSLLFAKLFLGYSNVLAASRRSARKVHSGDVDFRATEQLLDLLGKTNNVNSDYGIYTNVERLFTEEGIGESLDAGAMIALAASVVYGLNKTTDGKLLNLYKSAQELAITGLSVSKTSIQTSSAFIKAVSFLGPIAGYGFKIGRLAVNFGPIGWGATILLSHISNKIEESTLTRQPIRMYPLQLNGSPYLGGIYGYSEGDYFEDLGKNINENFGSIGRIFNEMIR